MSLFIDRKFTGHAGTELNLKIECDALTDEDIDTLAKIIARAHSFREVHGVPRGGLRLARALERYCSPDEGRVLVVDDVLTSGMSMEEVRQEVGQDAMGVVIFARGPCPDWVKPVFQLSDWAGP